jgi:hypothetical protein
LRGGLRILKGRQKRLETIANRNPLRDRGKYICSFCEMRCGGSILGNGVPLAGATVLTKTRVLYFCCIDCLNSFDFTKWVRNGNGVRRAALGER